MTIATGKYLERRLHGLKANRTGGEQGGRRRRRSRGTRSTSSRTTKPFLKFMVQCFLGLLTLRTKIFLFSTMFFKSFIFFSFVLCLKFLQFFL